MKIGLKEIVGQFLNSSDRSSHEFLRLWNMGVWGLRTEFNLDILGVTKTVLLDVNANKTVSLPADYMSFSKIGVINDIGEIVTFKRNEQLSNYHASIITSTDRLEGLPELNTIDTSLLNPLAYPYMYQNYWWGGSSYTLFGLSSGTATIGQYHIDEDAGVILLDPENTYTQLLLEYVSDGYDECCNDHEIDAKASEAMLSYLRWKNAIDKRKQFSTNDVRQLKVEYYREKRIAKNRINPVVIAALQDRRRSLTKLVARA